GEILVRDVRGRRREPMALQRVPYLRRRVLEVARELDLGVAKRRHPRERLIEVFFEQVTDRVELHAEARERSRAGRANGQHRRTHRREESASIERHQYLFATDYRRSIDKLGARSDDSGREKTSIWRGVFRTSHSQRGNGAAGEYGPRHA